MSSRINIPKARNIWQDTFSPPDPVSEAPNSLEAQSRKIIAGRTLSDLASAEPYLLQKKKTKPDLEISSVRHSLYLKSGNSYL